MRQLGEPICMFGEGPAERRNRLRELIGKLGEDAVRRRKIHVRKKPSFTLGYKNTKLKLVLFPCENRTRRECGEAGEEKREEEGTWYHEGPDTLRIGQCAT